MASTKRGLTIGLMAAAAVITSTLTATAQQVQLSLRIRNDANVPAVILENAKKAAIDIFANAAVKVTVVDGQADFMIVLLSRHNADKMHQTLDAMGFAPGSETARGVVAYVLEPRVEKIAGGYSAPQPVVLGIAIAHELGHLLLFNAHSESGLMSPAWNQADFRKAVQGNLLFTTAQAVRIREGLLGTAQPTAMVQ